ncbi:MAG TPA: GNAT family N-acetyltransferase [Candidatus Sulfotelmatobacter sp.]|nr:GNAT family N-acetyltransferase [Candidatus Sulfotelmatobacter sp.]
MSGQRTLSLGFREFHPSNYERIVEIYNGNYPGYPLSVAELRSRDESVDRTKYLLKRFECVDLEQDRIVGYGQLINVPDMYHPRKFTMNLLVDPEQQCRGIGRSIYDRIHEELLDRDAILAWTMTKEDLPKRLEFFRRRGFSEKTRNWESRLDLTIAETAPFQRYVDRLLKEGITFTTLAKEQEHGEDSLRRIYELVQLIQADMPREADFTPLSFKDWVSYSMKNPQLLPEGYIIAKDGPKYVGMSDVHRIDTEPGVLQQDDTGVIREYRGRGIATALKLKITQFGQKNGYRMIKTWNDSVNAAMLAVNIKLGFKRQVGWILMEKIIRPESGA